MVALKYKLSPGRYYSWDWWGNNCLFSCQIRTGFFVYQGSKLANPTDAYLGIKKLTANAFALKVRLLIELFINIMKLGETKKEPKFICIQFIFYIKDLDG